MRYHSCAVAAVAQHFERAPDALKRTFAAIEEALAQIGPHSIVPVKTMILVRATANFASVVVRKDALQVEFLLRRPLEHPRIHKRQQLGPTRYAHHVRLTAPEQVDAEIVSWLRESYQPAPPAK